MKTITVETSKLSGAALDWAVAKAVGHVEGELHDDGYWSGPDYSTDWSQGGPLIEKYVVSLRGNEDRSWSAYFHHTEGTGGHRNCALIAAMRAIVAAELGLEAEVPVELVEVRDA